jgi:CBS domain containing-hemolysin-like protein
MTTLNLALTAALICFLLLILALASYVDRIYSEIGRFMSREFQDNVDNWEELVEPRMGMERELLALSAGVLMQLSLALLALVFGLLLYAHEAQPIAPSSSEIAEALLAIGIVIVLVNRVLPYALFMRTRGAWIRSWRPLLMLLFFAILPLTILLNFLLSIAALAEPTETTQEEQQVEAVDALIEAGEEEGILEESDRERYYCSRRDDP